MNILIKNIPFEALDSIQDALNKAEEILGQEIDWEVTE